jgi:hypothetical protein
MNTLLQKKKKQSKTIFILKGWERSSKKLSSVFSVKPPLLKEVFKEVFKKYDESNANSFRQWECKYESTTRIYKNPRGFNTSGVFFCLSFQRSFKEVSKKLSSVKEVKYIEYHK